MVVYLDNNASTRPLVSVVEAMGPFFRAEYANPSSPHRLGQRVRYEVECAREKVAQLVNAASGEIIFTSGGTESINLAVRGALGAQPVKRHLITSAVEHSSVRRLVERLAREGYRVDEVAVDHEGRLDLAMLEDRITEDTALVSVIHANNETGVLTDARRVCEIAARHGVQVHLDTVQSVGKVPIDVKELPVDLLSLSAHKLHGPKGVGALYVRKRTRLTPVTFGGRQERDLRPGTENVPAIVGFGVAAAEAMHLRPEVIGSIRRLRDAFEARVLAAIPIAHVIGGGAERVCNTSNIGFERLQAEAILILLSERGICASAGAACSSGSLEPSHVLKAMGVNPRIAHGAIRFSLSRFTTADEIDRTIDVLREVIERLSTAVG
ncbi:MAG: aminotransferase class V-fold PLP-dependent enzyme [Phycisphaerales bacterium]|nr:MAG: aminotransferase class V-fold PLP-dependent enzyme [Phycisphaerales bacterium]